MKPQPLPLVRSDVQANLTLRHRQKGLLWFPTYGVDFGGRYEFLNDTRRSRPLGRSAFERRLAAEAHRGQDLS